MKNTLALVRLFIIILTVGLLFTGCSVDEGNGSPTNVVKRFITAIYNEDETAGEELALAFFGNYTHSEIIALTREKIGKKKVTKIAELRNYRSQEDTFVDVDFNDNTVLVFTLVRVKGNWKIGGIR